jgi:hypothetical protein
MPRKQKAGRQTNCELCGTQVTVGNENWHASFCDSVLCFNFAFLDSSRDTVDWVTSLYYFPPAPFFLMESSLPWVLRILRLSSLSSTAARVSSVSESISTSDRLSDNTSKRLLVGEEETFDFLFVCGVPGGGRGGVWHTNCNGVFLD